jgi:hypothetical protein
LLFCASIPQAKPIGPAPITITSYFIFITNFYF